MDSPWTPNLIMPGVAKCGTTTLHDILVTHPQIGEGLEKEVRFLMDAEETQPRQTDINRDGLKGWRDRYGEISDPARKWWIDSTPQYQYQKIAKRVIGELSDCPHILLMVRRPSARLYSMYQYAKYHQRTIDFIGSFGEFVDAIRAPVDPRLAEQTMLFNAWDNTDYDVLLREWQEIVGEDKVLMISLEDLIAERNVALAQVARFLSIDAAGFRDLEKSQSNKSVQTRNRAVRTIGSKIARFLPENTLTRAAKDFVKRLNSASIDSSEKAQNQMFLDQIDDHFAHSVEQVLARTSINRL